MRTQLDFFDCAPDDPNVRWLENLLKSRADWVSAAELAALSGRGVTEHTKRYIRQLASASHWIVSGQAGYRHLEHCTPEIVHHFTSAFRSQIRKMGLRLLGVQRNAHRLFG